jgi:hypothetical protein
MLTGLHYKEADFGLLCWQASPGVQQPITTSRGHAACGARANAHCSSNRVTRSNAVPLKIRTTRKRWRRHRRTLCRIRPADKILKEMTNIFASGPPSCVTGPSSPTHFCDMIRKISGRHLKIQNSPAGEDIPALDGFGTGTKGFVEMNAASSYF